MSQISNPLNFIPSHPQPEGCSFAKRVVDKGPHFSLSTTRLLTLSRSEPPHPGPERPSWLWKAQLGTSALPLRLPRDPTDGPTENTEQCNKPSTLPAKRSTVCKIYTLKAWIAGMDGVGQGPLIRTVFFIELRQCVES